MKEQDNQLIIFKTEDERISVDARFDEDTVWLTLDQMAALFERDKSTISPHIKNVFSEGELGESATVADFATVQTEGTRIAVVKKLAIAKKGIYDGRSVSEQSPDNDIAKEK
jgi:hypothetical protein